ncbi:hypothetical protein JCM10908_004408 [Rhodotorula pacifica]|uniref:uncharacterized protein n=1 Tax=Rhodotorula pacifica TaxID=1495444 RepID=UPI0031768E68
MTREPQSEALSPAVALELRLRFLESLLAPPPTASAAASRRVPITRHVAALQEQLRSSIEKQGNGSDAINSFVANYDANAPLLSVGSLPNEADSEGLTAEAKATLILEAEHEIRTLEKDLRELQVLNEQNVVDAGRLPDHEQLKESLAQTRTAAVPLSHKYSDLEARTTVLLQRYNHYISTMSELFVSWDDLLTEAETALTRMEKARDQPLDIS